jgi:hypothetical protein
LPLFLAGAKAMVAAKARRLVAKQTMRETAKTTTGASAAMIAYAEVVLDWAPELVDAVIKGASLNEASRLAYQQEPLLLTPSTLRAGQAGIDVNEDKKDRDYPPEADEHMQRWSQGLHKSVADHLLGGLGGVRRGRDSG